MALAEVDSEDWSQSSPEIGAAELSAALVVSFGALRSPARLAVALSVLPPEYQIAFASHARNTHAYLTEGSPDIEFFENAYMRHGPDFYYDYEGKGYALTVAGQARYNETWRTWYENETQRYSPKAQLTPDSGLAFMGPDPSIALRAAELYGLPFLLWELIHLGVAGDLRRPQSFSTSTGGSGDGHVN